MKFHYVLSPSKMNENTKKRKNKDIQSDRVQFYPNEKNSFL